MAAVTRRSFLKTSATVAAAAAATGKAGAAAAKPVRRLQVSESAAQREFAWPEGKRVALSLSFDDARPSQVDVAFPLFEDCGVKATFYVCPYNVEKHLDAWRRLHGAGHEIGNHTANHPCSGNFEFARAKALENYTLKDMENEIIECNRRVEAACGCVPTTFAYPCGNTFVGRGRKVRSYVPLVAKHFLAGRGFANEWHNAPAFCDLAQINGVSLDQQDFKTVRALVEKARADGGWLVLAGHDTGDEDARQVTRCDTLRSVCEYAREPEHGVWLDTVAAVAGYIRDWKHEDARSRARKGGT